MKTLTLYISIFFLIFFLNHPLWAEEKKPLEEQEFEILKDINPFTPALPKIIEDTKKRGTNRSNTRTTQNQKKSNVISPIVKQTTGSNRANPNQIQDIPFPNVNVKGIVWNTDRPQVIINNQILSVGDSFEDVKIIGITKSKIDVSFHDKYFTIKP